MSAAPSAAQPVAVPDVGVASAAPPKRRRSRRPTAEFVLVHLAFVVIIVFFTVPFIWLLTAAFDRRAVAYIRWPAHPTFHNFVAIFTDYSFGRALGNSLIVSTSSMVLVTLTVALAGYSLSRLRFRRKNVFTYTILLLQTMPLSATMVPIYGLAGQLHLRNSYYGLILVDSATQLPFLIWLMKGFFDSVPRYLEEAGWIDGASRARAWWGIVLPIAKPGIGLTAGLAFLGTWAEILMVLILIDSNSKMTVPLAFYQAFQSEGGYTEVNYQIVAAMGLLYLLPVLILFLATRKMMVRGLMGTTAGM